MHQREGSQTKEIWMILIHLFFFCCLLFGWQTLFYISSFSIPACWSTWKIICLFCVDFSRSNKVEGRIQMNTWVFIMVVFNIDELHEYFIVFFRRMRKYFFSMDEWEKMKREIIINKCQPSWRDGVKYEKVDKRSKKKINEKCNNQRAFPASPACWKID